MTNTSKKKMIGVWSATEEHSKVKLEVNNAQIQSQYILISAVSVDVI